MNTPTQPATPTPLYEVGLSGVGTGIYGIHIRESLIGDSILRDLTLAEAKELASKGNIHADLLAALEMAEATIQRLAPNGSRATQGTRDVVDAALARAKGVQS